MRKNKPQRKPAGVSRLYWSYLQGNLDLAELTLKQFNQIVLEQYIEYKQHGGYKSFEEYYAYVQSKGL
ncbi:hypothetical protein J2W97_001189 [Paenibacillus jamilae]|uniref:hypothetical protein n=1 Tax=unclassified Paenibacillus TaxID=185978 RepID=UPI00142DFEF9|nr:MULTISPECIES: hypothetical protein [unclassified Paenibacillus]MDP9675206.1 hypothetical protein [Paenibacillus jamilae]KAF6620464.1 hypothetical protein HFE00_05265 [Paenibacillus sp. EKM101P]KAF6623456.1 hypothetical protein HFE03_07360 [Paenibacillus sp. EKM102P]KAF6633982.1 hypothetical protein HFE01_07150 [Paenibacillus sp. EKM10P]KAF6649508.1 hypothetical protein HFE02_02110 [Paenibacillus sp. EKM11P]